MTQIVVEGPASAPPVLRVVRDVRLGEAFTGTVGGYTGLFLHAGLFLRGPGKLMFLGERTDGMPWWNGDSDSPIDNYRPVKKMTISYEYGDTQQENPDG